MSKLQQLRYTKVVRFLSDTSPTLSHESNDYLLRVNVDPIVGATKFRDVSCTRHVAIGRIRLSAWAVNYIVAISNDVSQGSYSLQWEGYTYSTPEMK
jgi:hypothetical protein